MLSEYSKIKQISENKVNVLSDRSGLSWSALEAPSSRSNCIKLSQQCSRRDPLQRSAHKHVTFKKWLHDCFSQGLSLDLQSFHALTGPGSSLSLASERHDLPPASQLRSLPFHGGPSSPIHLPTRFLQNFDGINVSEC